MPIDTRTGRQWTTGGNEPFREDLVAWPAAATPKSEASPAAAAVSSEDEEAEASRPSDALARALQEIERLHAQIESLVEENERLRRAAG
jgi:hypothetical protein